MMGTRPLLELAGVTCGYSSRPVLEAIDLVVQEGETVAVVGHNGAGKSTLLRTVFGLLRRWEGKIEFDGREIKGAGPRDLLDRGLAFVPQGASVFPDMDVRDNLLITIEALRGGSCRPKEALGRAVEMFPRLDGKLRQRAGTLSGGERQMVALARTLIAEPKLLLLDEPTLGLSEALSRELLGHLGWMNRVMGVAMVVVEQKIREVLRLVERAYVVKRGRVTFNGRANELFDESALRKLFF